MSSAPRRMTTAEYLVLPADDERGELVYGVVVVTPSPTWEHNDAVHNLGTVLVRYVRHHALGKVG